MKMLSIGELSARSGVTVRALRFYESKGLLAPTRSEARQRLYRYRDVVRLQQIQMLKRTGFTLKDITKLIGSSDWDAKDILEMQQSILKDQKKQIDTALAAVSDAITMLEDQPTTDLSTLCHAIKAGDHAMSEEKWQKVWSKFYTPEEQKRWKAAKKAVPDSVVQEHQNMWPALIARTEGLVATGADPTSDEALEVVAEWNKMTQVIYDIDPKLAGSAAKLYDNLGDWPSDGPEAPFSPEVWAFVKTAGEALKARSE